MCNYLIWQLTTLLISFLEKYDKLLFYKNININNNSINLMLTPEEAASNNHKMKLQYLNSVGDTITPDF